MKYSFLIKSAHISAFISTLSATTYNCAQFTNPNGPESVLGYNNAGTISGFYIAASTHHGFRQDASGGFTTIDPPGSTSTDVLAINNNGVVVGQYTSGGVTHFFTADASGNIAPVVAPAPYTILQVWGINDNGAISSNLSWTDASGGHNCSFAILNPGGSVTLVPGSGPGDPSNLAGSLNNALQMVEIQPPALADPRFARGIHRCSTSRNRRRAVRRGRIGLVSAGRLSVMNGSAIERSGEAAEPSPRAPRGCLRDVPERAVIETAHERFHPAIRIDGNCWVLADDATQICEPSPVRRSGRRLRGVPECVVATAYEGFETPVRIENDGRSNKDGRLDVFVRFPDSALWHITQSSAGVWN